MDAQTAKCEVCDVCGHSGQHGSHFGAVCCRACAAFFRRTAHSKWSTSKCVGGSCDRVTYFCKPCRLQRCFDIGMKTSNFQYNRDGLRNKLAASPAQTVQAFVGRPATVLFCDVHKPTKKTLIDVAFLVSRAREILGKSLEMVYSSESRLHRLTFGMKVVRGEKCRGDSQHIRLADQKEVADTWQFYFLTVAKWLTHFEEFQRLEQEVQLQILQCVWHIWATLDRHVATAIHRRNHPTAPKTEIVSRRGVIIDVASVRFDSSWLSDYPSAQIAYFLRQHSHENFDIIGVLGELEPTDVELTYMLAQLCFEYAGKRYQGEILKAMERFQEVLADDLHNYYVNERMLPVYLDRLAKMMRVNNAIQKNLWEHRPRMELAKLFNIVKIEFSHPEMFKDSGFN